MAGFKVFSIGEVLTAADVNSFFMSQTVMVFADAASRDAALDDNETEGMVSYRLDDQLLEVYDGASWSAVTPPLSLDDLSDVDTTGAADGQVLAYDGGSDAWENATLTAGDVGAYPDDNPDGFVDESEVDARIAAASVSDLSDVDTSGAADGDALVFDGTAGEWVAGEVAGGLSGTSYVLVAGDGTAAENGTALQAAYAEAAALTPYGAALSNTNRAWVVVAPGTYDTTLVMDTQHVNVVSLDGEMSVRLTGINVTANNVLVRGIDVGTTNFLIGDDLTGLVAEKCRGGDNSFGGFASLVVSGTFIGCTGGVRAFGGGGGSTASGTFINCTGGGSAFSGGGGTPSGTFINCTGGSSGFDGVASGVFVNCTAGNFAYGFGFGGFGTASGTFINCTAGNTSFGAGGTASGTFINCTADADSFGATVFGSTGTLSGRVLYSRLTSGTFPTPSSGGLIRLSLDGTFTEVNLG